MKIVDVSLESRMPYSQSRMHGLPKLEKEGADDYERRTWREKSSYDSNGIIYIPAMAFKQMLDSAAKLLGMQIPGKGKNTYSKHFRAGVTCDSDVSLGVHKDDVQGVTVNCNVTGVRGPGKRVPRTFPIIQEWTATARFVLFDETITTDVFEKHLTEGGWFVGIGRFRPENGGLFGRFKPVRFDWLDGPV